MKEMEENKQHSGEELFDSTLAEIEKNQERAASGQVNCIPVSFPWMAQYYPGVERGTYQIVTANSGVAKSKFARYLYVINSYEFIKNNPDVDITLRIFYFSLEETKEKFMMSIISYWLYVKHKKRISIKELRSIGKPGVYLNQEIIELIKQGKEYFADLSKYVTVIDNVKNPTGIFKTMQEFSEKQGKWTYKTINIDGKDTTVKDTFIYEDSNLYVMCIVDHIGLLHSERQHDKMLSKYDTIGLFSSKYAIELRNKYNNIIIVVQQQMATQEKKQFTMKGQSIQEKLEPSLDGLADNKSTQQDADDVFGLFAPDRYQIEEYEDYDILKLQDHFRMLLKLKGRDGVSNLRVPLYFDGAVNYFRELPSAKDPEMNKVYEKVRRLYE
jgi:replicative DNA helicase